MSKGKKNYMSVPQLKGKTPTSVVTDHVKKTKNGYKLIGTKEEKKMLKSMCEHHILTKRGKVKPIVAYGNHGKDCQCRICKEQYPTYFYEDGQVKKAVSDVKRPASQLKMMVRAIEADKETTEYAATLNVLLDRLPKVYGQVSSIAKKQDKNEKKKKRKKNQNRQLGGWYTN
jgi:hypothetical protein